MKQARFLLPAEHEMLDSMLYYQHQAEGLAHDFLDQVTEAVRRIENNPEAYPEINKAVHRCLVRRFPFALLYKISGDEVVILAVMHVKRHPSYWLER